MKSKTCLIGLGNILMQDDGVGVHAVNEIERRFCFTPEVDIIDGGTLGLSLLPLIEGYARVLFVDAVEAGLEPGAIVVLEGEQVPALMGSQASVHQAGLADLLYAATMAGVMPSEVCLVGIQPQAVELGLEPTALLANTLEALIGAVMVRLEAWGIRTVARDCDAPPACRTANCSAALPCAGPAVARTLLLETQSSPGIPSFDKSS